jgi:ethanolamine utilization protein EutP (predicted NTPase)
MVRTTEGELLNLIAGRPLIDQDGIETLGGAMCKLTGGSCSASGKEVRITAPSKSISMNGSHEFPDPTKDPPSPKRPTAGETARRAKDTPTQKTLATLLLLDRLIAFDWIAEPSVNAIVHRLRGLKERLVGGRLQLAAVGQFKRGKSTLLNALLGVEILPVGVLPVTAIPTFLEAGAGLNLRAFYQDKREAVVLDVDTPAQARSWLAQMVTEEGNPNNVRGLARVVVGLSSPFLEGGAVLIDSPGVGSTLQHNTQMAKATLPECDAVLFIVSPDPPITKLEIDYLSLVHRMATRIIVVLTKADLLEHDDADSVEAFLRRTLASDGDVGAPLIFRVSARNALRGKISGDQALVNGSGLPSLESHFAEVMIREKVAVLGAAVVRKACVLLTELRFQVALRLKALCLPLGDLEQRRTVFQEAITGFEAERRVVADLISADRKRTLDALDRESAQQVASLGAALKNDIEQRVAAGQDANNAWLALQESLQTLFEAEWNARVEQSRSGLAGAFAAHQVRVDELANRVQTTAAELLDIPFHPEATESTLAVRFLPYWVVTRPDALNPLAPGALDWLLPHRLRERHRRRRIHRAIDSVISRNVENLRWAVRQNVEDAFRRFASEMGSSGTRRRASLTRMGIPTSVRKRSRRAFSPGWAPNGTDSPSPSTRFWMRATRS